MFPDKGSYCPSGDQETVPGEDIILLLLTSTNLSRVHSWGKAHQRPSSFSSTRFLSRPVQSYDYLALIVFFFLARYTHTCLTFKRLESLISLLRQVSHQASYPEGGKGAWETQCQCPNHYMSCKFSCLRKQSPGAALLGTWLLTFPLMLLFFFSSSISWDPDIFRYMEHQA